MRLSSLFSFFFLKEVKTLAWSTFIYSLRIKRTESRGWGWFNLVMLGGTWKIAPDVRGVEGQDAARINKIIKSKGKVLEFHGE